MTDATLTATTPGRTAQRRIGRMALRGLLYLLLALFVAYYMLPLFVMAITSLKSLDEIRAGSLMSLPDSVSLASWATAWSSACAGIQCEGLQPFFWNSVKMVVPAVILSTFLGAVNGYALSHWRFRGANVIFALMLFGCRWRARWDCWDSPAR